MPSGRPKRKTVKYSTEYPNAGTPNEPQSTSGPSASSQQNQNRGHTAECPTHGPTRNPVPSPKTPPPSSLSSSVSQPRQPRQQQRGLGPCRNEGDLVSGPEHPPVVVRTWASTASGAGQPIVVPQNEVAVPKASTQISYSFDNVSCRFCLLFTSHLWRPDFGLIFLFIYCCLECRDEIDGIWGA